MWNGVLGVGVLACHITSQPSDTCVVSREVSSAAVFCYMTQSLKGLNFSSGSTGVFCFHYRYSTLLLLIITLKLVTNETHSVSVLQEIRSREIVIKNLSVKLSHLSKRYTSTECYRHNVCFARQCVFVILLTALTVFLMMIRLLISGDVHPNPGPYSDSLTSKIPLSCHHLSILLIPQNICHLSITTSKVSTIS